MSVAKIRLVMETLDRNQVDDYFDRNVSDEGDVEPLLLCEGVSIKAFNKYVARGGDDLPIGVRFLELHADGRLLVVDRSTAVHEILKCEFTQAFLEASGNGREIKGAGSTTASRGSSAPVKEADATFGPMARTLHRTPLPRGLRLYREWLTLAVEVGHWQSWKSLRHAARWWHKYPGMKYVLLLKIHEETLSLAYELYDVGRRPLGPRGRLPDPVAIGRIHHDRDGQEPSLLPPEMIVFEARQILSILPGRPVPDGVNDEIKVDLRDVLTMLVDSIGPA